MILNLSPGASPIRWLGPGKEGDTDYAQQDGVLFAWSESNLRYEHAWWLKATGDPIQPRRPNVRTHVEMILQDRPFNKEWLNV